MKSLKTSLASILTVILLAVIASSSYGSAKADIPEYEIIEALDAGVISLTLTGLNNGEEIEIKVERIKSKPIKINIAKGKTVFEFGDNLISIYADDAIQMDLSESDSDAVTIKQTGKTRITSGSVTAKKKGTGMMYQYKNLATRISAGD